MSLQRVGVGGSRQQAVDKDHSRTVFLNGSKKYRVSLVIRLRFDRTDKRHYDASKVVTRVLTRPWNKSKDEFFSLRNQKVYTF